MAWVLDVGAMGLMIPIGSDCMLYKEALSRGVDELRDDEKAAE